VDVACVYDLFDGAIRDTEVVDLITLDSYVKNKEIKKIDFIKIDVDGGEYEIIMGAINTLKKFKPFILIELSSREFKDQSIKIINLFKSWGYTFYSVENKKFKDSHEVIDVINKNKKSELNLFLNPNT
jgi:hypothetical protein